MKRSEKLGSSLKSMPENDATDVKWLDDSLEWVQKTVAYIRDHPTYLSVPDVGTEKEFLVKAKQVYRVTHSPNRKRGRRTVEMVAIDKLGYLSHELGQQFTQGVMIKALIDDLKLSKNTASKYAKLYRLSRQDTARFSQADQRWLCKNFGSESLSPAWWDNKFWQWFEARVSSSGLGEEIRKIFAGEFTQTELRQKCDEMEKLKQGRYALGRQHAGFTNAKDVLKKEPRTRPKMSQRTPG